MKTPAAGKARSTERVRIGVSACLLGERVRYDGGHKREAFLVDRFGRYVDWTPVCPEVECGMPTPRDFLRLVEVEGRVRMVAPATGRDYTSDMHRFARSRIRELTVANLSGYVFKSNSPSCGVEGVPIDEARGRTRRGAGLFASAVMEAFPGLPVEEEGRLRDPGLCANFVSRVFAYRRWKDLGRPTRKALTDFHSAHELVLMAHSRRGVRRLGAMLDGETGRSPIRALAGDYWREFSKVMRSAPTRRNHASVLGYMAGLISGGIDAGDRAELTGAIEEHRTGRAPLAAPLTLFRHHARRLGIEYLQRQVYLYPHPDEWMLLNQL